MNNDFEIWAQEAKRKEIDLFEEEMIHALYESNRRFLVLYDEFKKLEEFKRTK